ncbi:MAG: peptidoglycan DD-metalloendopeptidase family protein [Oscillospiraceae bacterium]|nr:peptidoglycan DD-metalloendopeptidase family protein [Oscillospiraceae bacterium]
MPRGKKNAKLQTVRVVERKRAPGAYKPEPRLNSVRIRKADAPGELPSLFVFTLIVIYKNLYILGATILRRKRRLAKRARLVLSVMRGSVYAGLFHMGRILRRIAGGVLARLNAPFALIRSVYREQKPVIAAKRGRGQFPWPSYMEVAEAILRLFGRIIATLVNHILPLAAALVLLFVIDGFVSQSFGLRVVYRGEVIGYVRSEADFDEASRNVRSRVIVGTNYTFPISQPNFQLVICENPHETNRRMLAYNSILKRAGVEMVALERFTGINDLANSIVLLSGQEVEEAYGFYLDDRFYGALENKTGILNLLDAIHSRGRTGRPGERIEFEKKIELTPKELYLTASIIDENELFAALLRNEEEEQAYVVQEGDTPSGIADKLGISYARLKELNPEVEDRLMPGDELKTRVARPFITVQTIFTDIYEEDVGFDTETVENALFAVSYRQVERAGVNGRQEVEAEITMVNGIEYKREILSTRMLVPPITQRVIVGTQTPRPAPAVALPAPGGQESAPPSQSVSSSGFLWPIAGGGGRFNGGLGSYRGHTGVDLGANAGTHIVASASGRVVEARWTYHGYGIWCRIQHDGGFSTLYAHMNQMYVNVGDYVNQGQVIGTVGRTGNAFGNHLHFEVRHNNAIRDPMQYISR